MVVVSLVLLAGVTACRAERVVELWRSPFGLLSPGGQSNLDPRDGSVWLIDGLSLTHVAADGALLYHSPGLADPVCLSVDTRRGACWVYLRGAEELLRLGPTGAVLSVTPGLVGVTRVIASPADGSAWCVGGGRSQDGTDQPPFLARVDERGREVWRNTSWASDAFLVASDGSAWVWNDDALARLAPDGGVRWQRAGAAFGAPLTEDPRDGSVWVRTSAGLAKLSRRGEALVEVSRQQAVDSVKVSPMDGSILVGESTPYIPPWPRPTSPLTKAGWSNNPKTSRLDREGREIWQRAGSSISYNYPDNSAWYMPSETELVRVSAEGAELHRSTVDDYLWIAARNPWDGSLWTASWMSGEVNHIALDGAVRWRVPYWVDLDLAGASVDQLDGSVWAHYRDELIHFAADGTELEQRPLPDLGEGREFVWLSVSPFDSTFWVRFRSTLGSPALLHLAPDGTELWRSGNLGYSVSISKIDGSVWTSSGPAAYHLAADGSQLWGMATDGNVGKFSVNQADNSVWMVVSAGDGTRRLEHRSAAGDLLRAVPLPPEASSLCDLEAVPSDGSVCLAASTSTFPASVLRVSSDGEVLWANTGFSAPNTLAVEPNSGSVWVAECRRDNTGSISHFSAEGAVLSCEPTPYIPFNVNLDARDGTVWLSDLTHGQIVHLAALDSGCMPDVPYNHWAVDEVEACLTANVVLGYEDGLYHPEYPVTRDQMAVYIARGIVSPLGDAAIPDPGPTPTFPDVPTAHWAYRHVEYAASQGVVQGYEDGSYRPNAEVSRDQMAVYIARAMVAPSGDAGVPDDGCTPEAPPFPDVACDHWARKHIQHCAENGVVEGYDDGLYHPDWVVTRDQMAVYIARAFGL